MARPSTPEPDGGAPVTLVDLDLAGAEHASRFALILAESARADAQPPFSDQSLVDLRSGRRRGVAAELDGTLVGVSIVDTSATPAEAELVVLPAARRRGVGSALLKRSLDLAAGRLLVWAHGDSAAARALAAGAGLEPVRELLQLRLSPVRAPQKRAAVTTFRPGADDEEWLALNALAFADHPEQGSLTHADLTARMAEDWFDPRDFLISRDAGGAMTGFCWLKVEPDPGVDGGRIGEFYAVGVAPDAQGTGLGRGLVGAGLERLEAAGIRVSSLYVEADNVPAVALYRSVGFVDHTRDVQFSTRAD